MDVTVRHHVEPERVPLVSRGGPLPRDRLQYALTVTAVNRGDSEEH